MSSSDGAQYDPGGGAALNRGARGLAQKIKDWTDARIAAAIAGRSGLTSLKINGAEIGLRQHLEVQMTGATGEDHPELDLVRAILFPRPEKTVIPFVIKNGGAVLESGDYDVYLDFGFEINDWILAADQPGDVVVGVAQADYATFPTFTSVVGTPTPSLASQQKNRGVGGAGFSGWTTTISSDRFLRYSLSGVATITRLGIYLLVTRV